MHKVRKQIQIWVSKSRAAWNEYDGIVILALSFTLAITLIPIYFWRSQDGVNSDFGLHLLFTRKFIQGRFSDIPPYILAHSGLQLLHAVLYWLTIKKVPLIWINVFILTSAQIVTAVSIYCWIGASQKRGWNILRAFVVYLLMIAAPVMLLAGLDGRFYYGYIGLANYHNPTIILLRPFALLSFWMICAVIEKNTRYSWKMILVSVLLVTFSAFVKPSYIFCLFPALLLMIVWAIYRTQAVDTRFLFCGVLLPGLVVLGLQGYFTYLSANSGGSKIIISALTVESGFSDFLAVKFLLSIIFPLTVFLVGGSEIHKDPVVLLAWCGFLIGAAQAYLLAESGSRLWDGNFRWGAQIMLFLLLVVEARSWLQKRFLNGKAVKLERWLVWITLIAHSAAGIAYIVYLFLQISYA